MNRISDRERLIEQIASRTELSDMDDGSDDMHPFERIYVRYLEVESAEAAMVRGRSGSQIDDIANRNHLEECRSKLREAVDQAKGMRYE